MVHDEENVVAIFFWRANAKKYHKNFEEDTVVGVIPCFQQIPSYFTLLAHTNTYITEPPLYCVPTSIVLAWIVDRSHVLVWP